MNKLKTNVNIKEYANTDLNKNIPMLFKIKSKITTSKPLTYISNDTGITRHYTPAAQEWYNSIYTYNSNYMKTLSIADKNLLNLLKSYFNFQISQTLIKDKTKRLPLRFRRMSTKRVFIGRGELKHTNSKILITFYVLNTEGMFLARNLEIAKQELFYPRKELERFVNYGRDGKPIITYNRPFTREEFFHYGDHDKLYDMYTMSMVNKYANYTETSELNAYYEHLTNLVQTKKISENEKIKLFYAKVSSWKPLDYLNFEELKQESVKYFYNKQIDKWRYFSGLLKLNEVKFTNPFISKLIHLVKNLYNKDVEFNIVKLKKMHLNSDIYTQAVSLKLKNRDNRLYKVLKTSLRKIKLPVISKISERIKKPNKNDILANRVRNNIISSMFIDNQKDPLNSLLLSFYPGADHLELNTIKRSSVKKQKISLKGFVLRQHLKHLKLRGIRVEAKGRLTRRATASRSVFKMKWKGGLKNVDSSFRGLSTIMLRGYHKSNVQYSVVNSKNRNGAFGVKGWVSSK